MSKTPWQSSNARRNSHVVRDHVFCCKVPHLAHNSDLCLTIFTPPYSCFRIMRLSANSVRSRHIHRSDRSKTAIYNSV